MTRKDAADVMEIEVAGVVEAEVVEAAATSTINRTVLPNGLTVLSEHMPGVRSVALGGWVKAASIHEQREKMGVSHLLEHMVFKGTPTRSSRDISFALENLGGSLDAYTSREHTAYQARVLDEHVSQAADVLADLMFRPLLRQSDLDLERNVVLEEIKMVEDTPDDLVFELHNAELWGDDPYGYSILGTEETVSRLTAEDLKELHQREYYPENIVVAAAGNIEHDQLVDILRQTGWADVAHAGGFGGSRASTFRSADGDNAQRWLRRVRDSGDRVAGSGASARGQCEPGIPKPSLYRHFTRDGSQTHIVFGSQTVPHNDDRRYAICLVNTLLGAGMSSRLFQRIREELALAYSIYTFQSFHVDAGLHGVYVGRSPETASRAAQAIVEELARVAKDGLEKDEIESGKRQLKGQITLSQESVTSRMYRAAGVELYGEEYRSLDEVLALIDSISDDTVNNVCREFFAPEKQTVVSLGPAQIKF